MQKGGRITAVIPTYSNTEGLATILRYLEKRSCPIVVVNNNPKTTLDLGSYKTEIRVLNQKENLGFAAGVNRGVQQVTTPWMVILNDDIEIPDVKLLDRLLDFAEKHRLIAVSPVLVDRSNVVENCGYRILPIGKVQLVNPSDRNTEVDGLTAACLLIKTDVFRAVGGFDERFFAYLEDVDLFLTIQEYLSKSRKVQKSEGQVAVTPFSVLSDSFVIHNHMTTSSKMKKGFKEWYDLVNWLRIIAKHPGHFRFSPGLLIERMRNFSGLIKKIIR